MANEQLDSFLGAGAPAPVPETPAPEPAPQPEPTPAPEPAKPDDDEAIPEPREGDPVVPRRALEDERNKRRDWKEQAVRAQTERDELRKQLDEAKKAPPAPREAPPLVNPAEDPQGYHARLQGELINERLNMSEMLAREKHGAEAIDAMAAEFKSEAERDPSLFPKLYAQPHPYDWMIKHVERLRVQREVGDDPAAWREAERAKLRAEIEAERNGTAPPPKVSPAAGIAPSLANARSAAPRSAPAFTGPPPLTDILPAHPGARR